MKPEVFATNIKVDWGKIPETWQNAAEQAGYESFEDMKTYKSTQVHQKMNGMRKKLKLTIPALSLEDVEAWFA